jgi:hypothetical protein
MRIGQTADLLEALLEGVPTEDELTKQFMTHQRRDKPISKEAARKQAQLTLSRIKNPGARKKSAEFIKDRRANLKSEMAAGKKYRAALASIKPDPSRDVKPFHDVLKGLSKAQVDMVTTGRRRPESWWHPFKPIEVILPDTSDPDQAKAPYLQDGNHRLKAAKAAGASMILAKVIDKKKGKTETVIIPLR